MKTSFKLLFLVAVLLMSSAGFAQQNYNINIGGLPISSGSAVPGSCPVDGAFFFKNTATESWSVCIGGTYSTLGAGGGLPAHLTYVDPTLTVSAATFGNGVLALSGNTSGTCNITAPAVAASTNPVLSSCPIQVPNGSAAAGGIVFPAQPIWFYGGGTSGSIIVSSGTNLDSVSFLPGGTGVGVSGVLGFSNGAVNLNQSGAIYTVALSRSADGVLAVGSSTTSGQTTGKVKASGYISAGTKFTTNAGCGESAGANVGGATGGKITTVGSTSCTTIVTLGDSATAPNGWDCSVTDLTTAADAHNPRISASNATTVTIVTGTIVSGDVLSFSCIGF